MATTLTNQASATFVFEGSGDTRTVTSNIVNTQVLDEYCLEVEKDCYQECFKAGENITYSITVTNCGCRNLRCFTITDDLGCEQAGDTPLTYLAGSARISINGNTYEIAPTDTSPLTFSVPNTLELKESFTITYVATVDENISSEILEIVNTVHVSAKAACKHSCERYCASTTSTLPRCNDAILRITKTASKSQVGCGDDLEYILTIENSGYLDATSIIVTDQLPENFTVNNIFIESEDNNHNYDVSEYDIDSNNILTIPNATGTEIIVRGLEPGVNHTNYIHIQGSFNNN